MSRFGLALALALFGLVALALVDVAHAACSADPFDTASNGFLPIIGPNNMIYSVRVSGSIVYCHNPATGARCPGYPVTYTLSGYTIVPNQFVYGAQFKCMDATNIECNRLYIPIRADTPGNVGTFGILCFDIGTGSVCSTDSYTTLDTFNTPTATFPLMTTHMPRYGDNLYTVTWNMQIHCYDTTTDSVCGGSFPIDVSSLGLPRLTGGTYGLMARIDDSTGTPQLYIVASYGGSTNDLSATNVRVLCYDLIQEQPCTGYAGGALQLSASAAGDNVRDFFFYRSPTGPDYDPVAVCIYRGSTMNCRSMTVPANIFTPTINFGTSGLGTILITHQQVGSKLIFSSLTEGLFCADFATASACTPPFFNSGDPSPTTPIRAYGPVLDPRGECLFSITNRGYIWNFDTDGNSPCENGPIVTAGDDSFVEASHGIYELPIFVNDENGDPSQLTLSSFSGPQTNLIVGIDTVAGTVTLDATTARLIDLTYQSCSPGFSVNPASDSTALIRLVICNDTLDFDLDGVNNCDDFDIDNDGIINFFEGDEDTDGDGFENWRDIDSDNDGIADFMEALRTSNTAPSSTNYDFDDNQDGIIDGPYNAFGVATAIEHPTRFVIASFSRPDTDGDGIRDFLDLDSDNDGLFDLAEGSPPGTNIRAVDTNNDGVLDATLGTPFVPQDSDGTGPMDSRARDADDDGIFDMSEASRDGFRLTLYDQDFDGIIDPAFIGPRGSLSIQAVQDLITYPDTDNDGREDFRDLDSDNDAIFDLTEGSRIGIDHTIYDTGNNGRFDGPDYAPFIIPDQDRDGIPDYRDLDSDNDGLCDIFEAAGSDITWYSFDVELDCLFDGPFDLTTFRIFNPPQNNDFDTVPDFRDLDSDNDGASDTREGGFLETTDNFTGPDSDNDGIKDVIDQTPLSFGGGVGIYYIPDFDFDGFPDYIDTISDGVTPDYSIKSSRSDEEGTAAAADPVTDADLDGIEDTIFDEFVGFGGLYYRTFDITKPTNRAVWKMYRASPIQWRHNLTADFDRVRITLDSNRNFDPVIFPDYPIGPGGYSINQVEFTPKQMLPDCIRVIIEFYSSGSASVASTIVRYSDYFALSTGTQNIYCLPPP